MEGLKCPPPPGPRLPRPIWDRGAETPQLRSVGTFRARPVGTSLRAVLTSTFRRRSTRWGRNAPPCVAVSMSDCPATSTADPWQVGSRDSVCVTRQSGRIIRSLSTQSCHSSNSPALLDRTVRLVAWIYGVRVAGIFGSWPLSSWSMVIICTRGNFWPLTASS